MLWDFCFEAESDEPLLFDAAGDLEAELRDVVAGLCVCALVVVLQLSDLEVLPLLAEADVVVRLVVFFSIAIDF